MQNATKWENIGLITSSEYRKKVLMQLEIPKTPSLLSKILDINKAHISKALKELVERKMVECLNPKSNKGKFFKISNYGKEILKEVLKLQIKKLI